MKVPSNIIKENQYTVGKEFVLANSYIPYTGPYYILNNRYFIGDTYTPKAVELIKIDSDKYNPLRANSNTSVYSLLNSNNISTLYNEIPSIPFNPMEAQSAYLVKKLNSNPVKIFFTNRETYVKETSNPLYAFTSIEYNPAYGFSITGDNIAQIPEIRIFLAEYSNVEPGDE